MKKKKINSKNKGSRVERDIAKVLSENYNEEFKRTPMSGAFGTANKYTDLRKDAIEVLGGDLICPPEFIFTVEIKSRINFNFWDLLNNDTENEIDKWINQVEESAKINNKEPLLIIKINNKKAFVLLPSKLQDGFLKYKTYTIIRLDYFLGIEKENFFKTKS